MTEFYIYDLGLFSVSRLENISYELLGDIVGGFTNTHACTFQHVRSNK